MTLYLLPPMSAQIDEYQLLTEIALTFPFGCPSAMSKKINQCYFAAHTSTLDDTFIGKADVLFETGSRRVRYINQALREMAEAHKPAFVVRDLQMGNQGRDNHVELRAGRFLITHHHQTICDKFPKDFLNFPAKYVQQNARLCNSRRQLELFDPETISTPESLIAPFNLLIVHRKSADTLSEVGEIEFILPQGRRKLVGFDISEVITRQKELEAMAPEDLEELRNALKELQRRTAS